jgi:hypothetical protein
MRADILSSQTVNPANTVYIKGGFAQVTIEAFTSDVDPSVCGGF